MVAEVEYVQTTFSFSTKSQPADRLFLCRQAVETTTVRLTLTVLYLHVYRVGQKVTVFER